MACLAFSLCPIPPLQLTLLVSVLGILSECRSLRALERFAERHHRLLTEACYATSDNHERAVLRQLLGELDLAGVLIQADALHTQKPFFGSSRSRGPTFC